MSSLKVTKTVGKQSTTVSKHKHRGSDYRKMVRVNTGVPVPVTTVDIGTILIDTHPGGRGAGTDNVVAGSRTTAAHLEGKKKSERNYTYCTAMFENPEEQEVLKRLVTRNFIVGTKSKKEAEARARARGHVDVFQLLLEKPDKLKKNDTIEESIDEYLLDIAADKFETFDKWLKKIAELSIEKRRAKGLCQKVARQAETFKEEVDAWGEEAFETDETDDDWDDDEEY